MMHGTDKPLLSPVVKSMLIALIVVTLFFVWQGHVGFSLWDEGFLWYGAQRVMQGEVPIRDFQSYDPGRYYWSAGFMSMVGSSGVVALRTAIAIFQFLGLWIAIYLIDRSHNKRSGFYLIMSAIVMVVWMYPRHKLFDISLALMLIGSLSLLIENYSTRNQFLAGVAIGIIAIFGRNHAIYGLIATLLALCWLSPNLSFFFKHCLTLAAGIFIGLLPLITMLTFVDGFASAFWEGLYFLLKRGSTNLTLPIPWPWTLNLENMLTSEAIREILKSLFFTTLFILPIILLIFIFIKKHGQQRKPPAIAASIFLMFPYSHYALSRADLGHLAQGIFPLLMLCLIIINTAPFIKKWCFMLLLSLVSIFLMLPAQPGWECFSNKQCINININENQLLVREDTAKEMLFISNIIEKYVPNNKTFIFMPYWPGAYALMEKKSPMWTIYALWKRSDQRQQKEIDRIVNSNVALIVIMDIPLDKRDDLKFIATYNKVYNYIINNYKKIEYICPIYNCEIYIKD